MAHPGKAALIGLIALSFCLSAPRAAPASAGSDLNPEGLLDFGGGSAGVPVLGFLKLPASARGIGMGAASLTTDEEASMIQGNPALLATATDYFYSVSHAEILGEFRHENMAFTWPTQAYGNFGGSARILAATAFEDARDIDEAPSNPTAYDIALGLSYARPLWEGLAYAGGRLDLIRSNLDGAVANGYAVNAGLVFMLVSDLRLGLAVNNLSHGITYDASSDSPTEPLPLNLAVELGKPLLDTRWSGQLGFVQGNEGISHFYAGLEWRAVKYLLARAGYEGSSQARELGNLGGLAAGVGIKYDRITLDYGYKTLGPLGAYHAFSLNYSRKAAFRSRDDILLEKAQAKYHQGKYKPALRLARAAIAANPYNFKAQALATKLQLELDRMSDMAVTLAYTANTDGRLASEWRNGRPLGGLPRRKTKLIELKGALGKCLILDAGNLTNPATNSAINAGKAEYVYGAYAQIPYDAVNAGASDLMLGPPNWDPRLPWMSSQKPWRSDRAVRLTQKSLKIRRGGEVLVLGAIDPASMPRPGRKPAKEGAPAAAEPAAETVAQAVVRQAGPPRQGRILVLLMHGSLTQARNVALAAPDLDVIILSGEGQALGSPMKSGKTLICSPGRGGTHVGELTLLLNQDGTIRSFRHFLTPLDPEIPEDGELKRFLEPVTVDPNKIAFDDYDEDYRSQLIAYISSGEPGSAGALRLRDLRTGKDYRIQAPGLRCSSPMLGYGKNRIAFEGEDGSGSREIFTFEPGVERIDTLTRLGGRAGEMRWILRNNALLALYERGGESELYRIDPWSREVRELSLNRFGSIVGFDVVKDGVRLAMHAVDGNKSTLWVTNLEFESPIALVSGESLVGSPRWSPKGDRLAFLVAGSRDTGSAGSGKPAPVDTTARANGAETDQEAADPAEMDAAGAGDSAEPGELRVFDFATKQILTGTRQSRVRSFSWSVDGKRIYYSAGVNLADINVYHPDSASLAKVTAPPPAPRSEGRPTPKVLGDRDGLLFEAAGSGWRKILWMDLKTRKDSVLIDSSDYNSLR
jgi:hypothetical protein